MQENNTDNTLKQAKWLLGIGVLLIIAVPYILTRDSFIGGLNFMNTGPIGDTIGGITAPFVNLVAAGLVFLALRAQVQANGLIQIQIEDQKAQRHADLINQAIQTQIARTDESVRAATFDFVDPFKPNATGYHGLLEFNEAFELKKATSGFLLNDPIPNVSRLIHRNISPLTEVYDRVSAAVVLVDRLIMSDNLDPVQQAELRRILLLNLGESFQINLNHIAEYVDWYTDNTDEIDKIYQSNQQMSRLRQLINTVRDFYNKTPLQDT